MLSTVLLIERRNHLRCIIRDLFESQNSSSFICFPSNHGDKIAHLFLGPFFTSRIAGEIVGSFIFAWTGGRRKVAISNEQISGIRKIGGIEHNSQS